MVRASQADGVAAVRPGAGAKEVDDVCRTVIAEAGWAERLRARHRATASGSTSTRPRRSARWALLSSRPASSSRSSPGVYLPGIGGVRIEDTLVVTDDGSRPLTTFTKDVAA